MVAYQDIFDYKSAITQAHKAAEYSLSARDSVRYLSTLNSIVILYGQLDDNEAYLKGAISISLYSLEKSS